MGSYSSQEVRVQSGSGRSATGGHSDLPGSSPHDSTYLVAPLASLGAVDSADGFVFPDGLGGGVGERNSALRCGVPPGLFRTATGFSSASCANQSGHCEG